MPSGWTLLALLAMALAYTFHVQSNAGGEGFAADHGAGLHKAYSASRDHALWQQVSRTPGAMAPECDGGAGGRSLTVQPEGGGGQYDRVLVLADLHGDLSQAEAALKLAGAVDEAGRWAAGQSLLVQLGDLVDRGNNSLGVLDLFLDLQAQAQAAGGKVVNLLGNHEAMLIMGDTRYVNREEVRRLGRQALLRGDGDGAPELQMGEGAAAQPGVLRSEELRQWELAAGWAAWRTLLSPDGRYGSLLRARPLSHLVQSQQLRPGGAGEGGGQQLQQGPGHCDMLFVHAGVLEWMLDAVDKLADAATASSASLAPEESESGSALAAGAETGLDAPPAGAAEGGAVPLTPQQYIDTWNLAVRAGLEGCAGRGCPKQDTPGAPLAGALLGGDGAVWTRALVQQSSRVCAQVAQVTKRLGVSRIVVGHTIQEDGVSVRCKGQLLLADVGMSAWIKGDLAALTCSRAEGLKILQPSQEPRTVLLEG